MPRAVAFSLDPSSLKPVQSINRDPGPCAYNFCSDPVTGHSRHGHIADHQIKGIRISLKMVEGLSAVAECGHLVAQAL